MKGMVSVCCTGLFLSLLANNLDAEDWHPSTPLPPLPGCCQPPPPGCATPGMPGLPGTTGTPGTPTIPGVPSTPGQQPMQSSPEAQNMFNPSAEAGSLAANTFDPGMFGDLIGPVGQPVNALAKGVTAPGKPLLSGNRIAVVAPIPYRGAFKITENESPRPTDRVFIGYNYFEDVNKNFVGAGGGGANLNRETIGFEKTFLDGNASIGMRLPFLELTGNSTLNETLVDDLSIIFKYAFINNRQTGDVLSAGLVVTVPTAPAVVIEDEGDLNSTFLEPFIGYIFHFGPDLYIQGFSSISVPTDGRDATLLFNSIGVNYWIYRDRNPEALVIGIIPDLELHLNDPLNHRGLDSSGPIGYQDTVDLTMGVNFLFRRISAGVCACVPLTGPKPYEYEIAANLNFHF